MITQVTSQLHVGDWEDAARNHDNEYFDVIMTVADGSPYTGDIKFPLIDWPLERNMRMFPLALDVLNRLLDDDKRVLVHCIVGISRSPVLCMAHLITRHGYTAEDALRFLKEKRPIVNPIPYWIDVLKGLEISNGEKLRGLA